MGTADFLMGELERHFELETMMSLSTDLLGLDPAEIGGTGGKGAFARALVERCAAEHGLEALADAIALRTAGSEGSVAKEAVKAEPELPAGTEIADFRILKRLGKGPLSTTYLADVLTPANGHAERVALKVFTSAVCRDRGACWRFLTRMRALKAVRAGGLARVYDAGSLADDRVWVATEHVTGQSLAGRLSRTGAIHFNEMRSVARSVLRSLEALHSRGLLHGNLKAENLFLVRGTSEGGDGPGEAAGVLVDAGQAQLLETSLPANDFVLHVVGEPATVAPERLNGEPESVATDVYAVASLLYQAVAGRPPFQGDTPFEVLTAQLMEMPEPPSAYAPKGWVPEGLDAILLRALSKDVDERYASAGELADALEGMGRSMFPPAADQQPIDVAALMRAVAAVQENPEDENVAAELEALVEPSREWQQAVDAFLEAADSCEDPDATKALLFRTARILDQELGDAEGAEGVYRVVLEIDAADAHAHNSIEELRRARGDHEGLVELLLDRLENEADSAERANVLREVAALYEDELGSPDNAQVAWTQVLMEEPQDERAVAAIERLTQSPEQWQEVLSTLHEGLSGAEDRPTLQLHLHVLLGRWWDERVHRPDVAVSYFSHALRLDPAHEPALTALTELYRRTQSWAELAQMLVHRADSASTPAAARDLRTEAALVYLEQLEDAEAGGNLLQEVIEGDPSHARATEAFERLLAQAEDWEGVSILLEAKASELRGVQRGKALTQLAELYENRLDDLHEAERRYSQALAADERNLEALKGLERVHARTDNHAGMLEVIDRQLALGVTPNQRVSLLVRAGSILEEALEDHAAAAERFEQVIEVSPGNEQANAGLARLYRKLQRFDELAQTLDRHAKSVENAEVKAQLLMQAARVLMGDLGSPERAQFMCERVLGLVPGHSEALELSARIKALGGDTLAAIDALEVMADTETDASKKAELWVKAGKHLEEAEDLEGAIERYRQALDADPTSQVATDALRRLFERRGDAHGEADLLLRRIQLCDGDVEKAATWVELAKLRETRLREPELAIEAYQRAATFDRDNIDAALGLGKISLAAENWEAALSYLRPLMQRQAELDTEGSLTVHLGVGQAARALEQDEEAEEALLLAKTLAPKDLRVLEPLAMVSLALGKHSQAARLLSSVLEEQAGSLGDSERAELLLLLGMSQHAAGALPEATQTLEQALDLAPESTDVLDELSSVQRERGLHEGLVKSLQKRIELANDANERFELQVEIGDVQLGMLDDRNAAADSYVAALELRGADRNVLAKLMSVYSADKDWSKLMQVLERMAAVVDEPAVRAKYLVTAASLAQQELGDFEASADLYERALEASPTHEVAFRGLAESLTRGSDWAGLARAYRAHLGRVKDTLPTEQVAQLWDNLAQLLHYRLERTDEAVDAYQQAQALDPDDRQRLERLAEIYGKHPGRYADQAVQTHSALLRHNPYRMESYQALRKLYTQVQRPDEAWCVCQALRALNVAEPDEEAFFKRYRVQAAATAQECATEEIWREYIVHPDQDPLLTAIFAAVTPAAIASTAQPLEAFSTDARYQVDAGTSDQMMPQMLHYAAGVALLPLPPVFYRPHDSGGLSFVYTSPPAIGVGQGALADTPDQALAFIAGRHLSYFRSGHYMRQLVPTGSGLRAWLLAAVRLSNPRFPVPDSLEQQVQTHHAAITQTLTAPQQQSLRSMVDQLLRSATELDMKKWAAAVDLTADRVGFMLANSLDAAVAVVRASPADSSYALERDRLRELYLYAVSPRYFALRKSMGIQIG